MLAIMLAMLKLHLLAGSAFLVGATTNIAGLWKQHGKPHKEMMSFGARGTLQSHHVENKTSLGEMHLYTDSSGLISKGKDAKEDGDDIQGAVVYLFDSKREHEFSDSLRSVCAYLDGLYAYPILVVHGHNVKPEVKTRVSKFWKEISPTCKKTTRVLEWVKWLQHDPDGQFDARKYSSKVPSLLQTGSSSRDYNSMIGFWITDIFQIAHRRGLKYIMRLDTDSLLASTPKEDPFMQMERTGAAYGYRAFCYDEPGVSEGIWKSMRSYVKEEHIKPSFEGFKLDGEGAAPMMYTNFEVANVEFFRRPEVHKFGIAMLKAGTHSYRLGDAVIRAFQLGLFASHKNVLHLDDFRYKHSCERWWWVIDDDRDCVVEEKDPFILEWGRDAKRFGPPIGQCYSSRLRPEILALENGPHEEVARRRLKVKESKAKQNQTPTEGLSPPWLQAMKSFGKSAPGGLVSSLVGRRVLVP